MTEKYYIASESDLLTLRSEAYCAGFYDTGEQDDPDIVDKAEAACRARPFNRETFAAICTEVDRQQKNGDFAGSFFEGVCKQLFGDEK